MFVNLRLVYNVILVLSETCFDDNLVRIAIGR